MGCMQLNWKSCKLEFLHVDMGGGVKGHKTNSLSQEEWGD